MLEDRIGELKRRATEKAERDKRQKEKEAVERSAAETLLYRFADRVWALRGLPLTETYHVQQDGETYEVKNSGPCGLTMAGMALEMSCNKRLLVAIEAVPGEAPTLRHDDTTVDMETAVDIFVSVAEKYIDA